jgi:hypothetical protein
MHGSCLCGERHALKPGNDRRETHETPAYMMQKRQFIASDVGTRFIASAGGGGEAMTGERRMKRMHVLCKKKAIHCQWCRDPIYRVRGVGRFSSKILHAEALVRGVANSTPYQPEFLPHLAPQHKAGKPTNNQHIVVLILRYYNMLGLQLTQVRKYRNI